MKFKIMTVVAAMALAGMAVPAAADDAAALYKAKCAACHGADGKGDTVAGKKLGARDFHSPDVEKLSEADMIKVTKEGKGKMPAFKALTDDQVKELVTYIRSLK